MTITVKLLLHSKNKKTGDELVTFHCRYPRFIHSEIKTHRSLSTNSSSSRAVPVSKLIEMVENDPAMPCVWGKNRKGMQAVDTLEWEQEEIAKEVWLSSMRVAVHNAKTLAIHGIHKQLANRLVEPFSHIETLVSGTEWANFFNLRCHKDAQPEFQKLAYEMLLAYHHSTPQTLEPGEWHLPFANDHLDPNLTISQVRKIVTARAARISYFNFDGKIDYEKDYQLHDQLIDSGHYSPTEHSAMADSLGRHSGNFKGWIQYRKFLYNENQDTFDAEKLLKGSMFYQEGDI